MQVYIYQADIYCEYCGLSIRQALTTAGKAPANRDDETTFDSDDFPKGPYPDGGGEADCPQHCGSGEGCINAVELINSNSESTPPNDTFKVGVSLENGLTEDGVNYVREAIEEDGDVATQLWAELYADELS